MTSVTNEADRLPYWTSRVPDVATFALCDDFICEAAARACFGAALRRFRVGAVRDHCRVFALASWLSASAGEGCLETGEVAVPALVSRQGAVAQGVALLDIAADDSRWARFYLGEPGFHLVEVTFEAEDGEVGTATARLAHASDAEARSQEGGNDDWFMSLWQGPLWIESPMHHPPALPFGSGIGRLRASPELASLPQPGTKLVRCDGCGRDFESSNAWRCHVEGVDGGDGCPDSAFFPTEVEAYRPEPFELPPSLMGSVFPAPGLLRRMLAAARAHCACLPDMILDGSLLADRRTPLRAFLEANAEVHAYVLGKAADSGGHSLHRWQLCPLLRSGPLVVYRGSEGRPHAIRRALLQQGAHHMSVAAAFAAGGCSTLDEAAEHLARQRRAAWAAPPRCAISANDTSNVSIVFDVRLDAHCCPLPAHALNSALLRLEGPQRTHAVIEQLSLSGLLAACSVVPSARQATEQELRAVHAEDHVKQLLQGEAMGALASDGDFYTNAHTSGAALLCAGAHADVAVRIAKGELRSAMCVTRPPGHHAGGPAGFFSGGCFVNNVAIAVASARAAGAVQRVLVVDWDVHHGDGTQEVFYEDPDVLTVSLHRFEHEPDGFYPSAGLPAHCGRGKGLGFNVNLAFVYADSGYGDADFAAVFEALVLPVARAFAPEFLVVAAGYDSARGDPLGGFDVTPAGYAWMLAKLQALPSLGDRGPLISLEGGYSPEATAAGMEACLRSLLGKAPAVPPDLCRGAKRETAVSLAAALHCQEAHWPCLLGWEDEVVAGMPLGNLLFPRVLECRSHAPCWCGADAETWMDSQRCWHCGGALCRHPSLQTWALNVVGRCAPELLPGDGDVQMSCERLRDNAAGTSAVVSVSCSRGSGAAQRMVVKLVQLRADATLEESLNNEANFYERGSAERLLLVGATCPRTLRVERGPAPGQLALSLTHVGGARAAKGLTSAQTAAAVAWLAKMHAAQWGARADTAVSEGGLRLRGCFWDLEARRSELERVPPRGWQGRLKRAAGALDARLRADRHQTICHGDAKSDNMLFGESGGEVTVACLDFEHAGKAQPAKDLAYCLLCTDHVLSEDEQSQCLARYLEALGPLLVAQGEQVPTLLELHAAYLLSLCDFARWLCGAGQASQEPLLQDRCAAALDAIDGGSLLASEEAYNEAVFAAFPLTESLG